MEPVRVPSSDFSPPSAPPPDRLRRWYLLSLATVSVSLCSGLVYGWPSLRRNLREAGGSTLTEAELGIIFTAGSWSTQGGRFAFGLARDRHGTRRTALVSFLCVVGGSIGVAFSDPNGAAQLSASMLLIGFGSGAQICLQPVAGLFRKRTGTVLASLSGAFQVSGLVFPALTSIADDRRAAFGGFAAVVALLAAVSAYALPQGPSFEKTAAAKEGEGEGGGTSPPEATEVNPPPLWEARLRRYRALLLRMEYIALVSWFCVCIVPLQYYIGSIGFQLEAKGDADGFYTNLFSVLYASSAALSPFAGYLADKFGLGVTQAMASSLCATSFFILASDADLNGQAAGLAAYGTGRLLVFGMYFSHVGKRFGYANYGLLAGVGLLISAVVSLAQQPLIAAAADGMARMLNLVCGGVLVGTLPYCLWLGLRERRGCPACETQASAKEKYEVQVKGKDNKAEAGVVALLVEMDDEEAPEGPTKEKGSAEEISANSESEVVSETPTLRAELQLAAIDNEEDIWEENKAVDNKDISEAPVK